MRTVRALAISAIAASLVVTGCSSVVDGAARGDGSDCAASETTGQCYDGSERTTTAPTTTTPAPTTEAKPFPQVAVCEDVQCTAGVGSDEVSLLVADALEDVVAMWEALDIDVSLRLYKNGTTTCSNAEYTAATAWVCPSIAVGGWNPAALRTTVVTQGVTLDQAVRATIAHEVGHIVLFNGGNESDDHDTNEFRADCMGGVYSRWTDYGNGDVGSLPLDAAKKVLFGSKSVKAVQVGYDRGPNACTRYTP